MIDKLTSALEHLDAAIDILSTCEHPVAVWDGSDLQQAGDKIELAQKLITHRLKRIEEYHMYVAKGGKPWPAVLE
jgi:hypothetical protein